jgi:hypothetical protein
MLSWLRRRSPLGPAAPAVLFQPPAAAETPALPLGEVAGALLGQLTLAQAQADDTALRCGEAYRHHPWLARFPVPSLTIESVEVDLPVVMVHAGSIAGAGDPDGTPDGAADPGAGALHVLFTAAQLQSVPPALISTVRLKLRCTPKRLAEVNGQTLLLP